MKLVVIKGGTLAIEKSEHVGCVDIVLERDAIRARVVLDVDQACELIHELALGVNEARTR